MASLEDYANWLVKNKSKVGTDDFNRVAAAYQHLRNTEQAGITANEAMNDKTVRVEAQKTADRQTYSPTKGMSGTDLLRAGSGKAVADTGRGISQAFGGTSRAEVSESRKRDAPLMQTGAGVAGNIAGNVAMAAPTMMIPGPIRFWVRGAIGAGAGFMQPSTSTKETLNNIGLGFAGSAAVPALITAGRVGKSLVDPFYEGGRNQILARALRDASGGQADDAIRQLRAAAPIVPGSLPTVGEATNIPSLAATQRAAMATSPQATIQLAWRQAAQNEARIAALQGLAGTPASREAAAEARDLAAQVAYGRAKSSDAMRRSIGIEQQINEDAANIGLGSLANLPKRTEAQSAAMAIRPTKALEDLTKRPTFSRFVDDAKRLAADKGVDIGSPLTSIDGLHYIKLAIDDALQPTATNALGRNAKSSIMGMKDILVKEMDAISPVYGVAREAYQQASRPINQMAIGEELLGSVRPIDQQIMPGQFARRLSDETAQRATGFKGATLANTLEPDQMKLVNALRDDLSRSEFAKNAGRGVGSDTVQKLAYSNMIDQAGVPSFVRGFGPAGVVGNVAQRFGQVAYKDANERIAAELADLMLNPQMAAQVMESGAVNPQTQALINGLRRSGLAIGTNAPGLVNAKQE